MLPQLVVLSMNLGSGLLMFGVVIFGCPAGIVEGSAGWTNDQQNACKNLRNI